MKFVSSLFLVFAVFLVFGLSSCEKDEPVTYTQVDFIANNKSFKDFTSWTLVKTTNGKIPISDSTWHFAGDTASQRKIYSYNNQGMVNGKYPMGTLFVITSIDSLGKVSAKKEWYGMAKRGEGYNSNSGNWEFITLDSLFNIAGEDPLSRSGNLKFGQCASCHSGSTGKDFIFSK